MSQNSTTPLNVTQFDQDIKMTEIDQAINVTQFDRAINVTKFDQAINETQIEEGINVTQFGETIDPTYWNSSEVIALSFKEIYQTCFHAAVFAVATPANLIVIISLMKDKTPPSTGFNTYAISVGFTDFIVGLFIAPANIYLLYPPHWEFGRFACFAWKFLEFGLSSTSMILFIVMGYDRYRCVKSPLEYRAQFRRGKILKISIFSWIGGFSMWVPTIVSLVLRKPPTGPGACPFVSKQTEYYYLIQLFVSYETPLVLLIVTNIFLVKLLITPPTMLAQMAADSSIKQKDSSESDDGTDISIVSDRSGVVAGTFSERTAIKESNRTETMDSKQGRINSNSEMNPKAQQNTIASHTVKKAAEARSGSVDEKSHARHKRNRKSSTLKILIMVATFLAFWAPICVLWPVNIFCGECINNTVFTSFSIMVYGQSAANPLIIIFFSKEIRADLRRICSLLKKSDREKLEDCST